MVPPRIRISVQAEIRHFTEKRPLRITHLPNLMVTIYKNSQRPQKSTFSDDINSIGHLQQKQLLKNNSRNSGNFFVNRKKSASIAKTENSYKSNNLFYKVQIIKCR